MGGIDTLRLRYALSDKFSGQCTLLWFYNEVSIGIKTSQFNLYDCIAEFN